MREGQKMKGTAIVTGAYGAIGLAIAEGIAKEGYHVVLVGRDENRLNLATNTVSRLSPDEPAEYAVVDLSSYKKIVEFGRSWNRPLNILVNNAATAPHQRTKSADGIEMQWAVNVLGYFHMIRAFAPHMKEPEHARIVNVASYWAGDLDLGDPEFKERPYDNDTAYRQSKQCDRMLTRAFAEKLNYAGITVNACHPADVSSKLSNELGFGGHETPETGAATPLWLAVSDEVKGISGKYFARQTEEPCHFMANRARVESLFSLCEFY
jgi:NAD(P)-dependent dehydrogenase (short-subunit alcohol dehydrogenase family)